MNRYLGGVGLLTLLAIAFQPGCSIQAASGENEGAESQPLYGLVNSLWPETDISVCWESVAQSTSAARGVARNAVKNQWGKAAGLTFSNWSECTAAGADIRIKAQDARSFTTQFGENMRNVSNGMVLNLSFTAWGNRCSCSAAGMARWAQLGTEHPTWTDEQKYAQCRVEFTADACIASTAVHEFGHALGFDHEQNRSDAPATCGEDLGTVNGSDDAYVDAFDTQSIMNYCNPHYNNYGQLSIGDINGARAFYGWGSDQPVVGNIQGDARADLTVYRPRTGEWYRTQIGAGSGSFSPWGVRGDIAVSGDYDGDGVNEYANFRPDEGKWYVQSTSGTTIINGLAYGSQGDQPLSGDFDGDGKTDVAVWRRTDASWHVRSVAGAVLVNGVVWGQRADVPVVADYDGDGKDDMGLWRPSTGEWWILTVSGTALAWGVVWGVAGDIPAPADFDGDGKADLGIFRPSEGKWYARKLSGAGLFTTSFGAAGDVPVPADYDNDGKADLAYFRPSTASWSAAKTSGASIFTQTWGEVL